MNTQELAEKLAQYPELKKRFEELVLIVENSEGETQLADVAEQRVIDSLRDLGHEALSHWAQKQAEQASRGIRQQIPKARKHIKKSQLAQQLWRNNGMGADLLSSRRRLFTEALYIISLCESA